MSDEGKVKKNRGKSRRNQSPIARNQEFEDKITAAMAKIVADTMNQESYDPYQETYGEEDFEEYDDYDAEDESVYEDADEPDWDDEEEEEDPEEFAEEDLVESEEEFAEEDFEESEEESEKEVFEESIKETFEESEETDTETSGEADAEISDTADESESAEASEEVGEDTNTSEKPRRKKRSARPQNMMYTESYSKSYGETEDTSETKKRSARPQMTAYVNSVNEEAEEDASEPVVKKHKVAKCLGITAAILLSAAATGYAGMSYYYADRFFEGTKINGIECSGKTALEVENLLESKLKGYSIQILSRNQNPQSIDASAIKYHYISNGEVLDHLKSQKPYEWIMGYIKPRTYVVKESSTYDKALLKAEMKQLECAKEENQVPPENAYVAYTENQFEIIPETEGSELNIKLAYQALEEAVNQNWSMLDFSTDASVYEKADILSTDEGLQVSLQACNNFAKTSITYDFGEEELVLDGSVIKDWLEFDDRGQLIQDENSFTQHIIEYVDQLKEKYDTVGTDRVFHTTTGRTVYVHGTAYGWKIDKDAEVAQLQKEIQAGTVVKREPNYSMRANARGENDFGNTYIEVDLAYQHMYYYQDGAIIFNSDIVSGNPNYSNRVTPPGIFTLYYKTSPETLRGDIQPDGSYGYETQVTYWMPFNGGIGFHDATWQPYFGGDCYLWNGSHGCINLPYNSAAALYNIIQTNVPIIVFN